MTCNYPKIMVLGGDGIQWALDKEKKYLLKVLEDLNYPTCDRLRYADIIYYIWWNKVLSLPRRSRLLKKLFGKTIVAAVPNDLAHQEKDLLEAINIVDYWVYFNNKQKQTLLDKGVEKDRMFYSPPCFDEKTFRLLNVSREDICKRLNIDFEKIQGKFLIGSFQRDSFGSDLTKQKWQKNPDMLLEIAGKLEGNNFLIVLAGPRRHYIIRKFEEYGIPFIYLGDIDFIREMRDDIKINVLPLESMSLLYNLIDLYVVGSKSEGGPASIVESCLCKTAIISTNVGFAAEFLDDWCIYKNSDEAKEKIERLQSDIEFRNKIIEDNYNNTIKINNYQSYIERTRKIIEAMK